ncbi:MAG: phosphate uptake regulator PhoU [Thaumarchaeota archaeon]|jgi:phosphate uptake regulator|nr:phosphate uptake regulator PhoU [Candidatus Geocrenenecus arthurdayi]
MQEYIRKVQVTGKTTLSVSLPKDWVEKAGLKPGSIVRLIPRSNSSLILICESQGGSKREARVSVREDTEAETLLRELISLYLAGYDIINIEFSVPYSQLKLYLKENMRKKLMGMEVLNESMMEMLLQCFAQHVELPLAEALERQAELAASMQRDATIALLTRDRELAEEVIQRDDEVDKLFYFISRQLNLAAENPQMLHELGIENVIACLSYSSVTKSIERIADHASNIASTSLSLEEDIDKQIALEFQKLDERIKNIFLESKNILLMKDSRLANQLLAEVEKVRKVYDEVVEKAMVWKTSPKNTSILKTVLGDYMRIAEYSADIAEQAILLSILEK